MGEECLEREADEALSLKRVSLAAGMNYTSSSSLSPLASSYDYYDGSLTV